MRVRSRYSFFFCSSGVAAVNISMVFGLAFLAQIRGHSQAGTPGPYIPRYEVSTVKATKPDDDRTMLQFTPVGISMTGIPVQVMLDEAFGGVADDLIIGAPNWVKSDRFDIQAKVNADDAPELQNLTFDQRRRTLLPLLEDRFNLKFHHETRELPVYTLVVAKSGSRLKESEVKGPVRVRKGDIESEGEPINQLIHALSQQIGHTIVNKTGLAGNYAFRLNWTPDDAPIALAGSSVGSPSGSDGASTPESGGPSLFAALEEQLGLKLDVQKGPVDVIVIDQIELPSPN